MIAATNKLYFNHRKLNHSPATINPLVSDPCLAPIAYSPLPIACFFHPPSTNRHSPSLFSLSPIAHRPSPVFRATSNGLVLIAVLLLLAVLATPVHAASSVNVSLDRDIYKEMEFWSAEGLITGQLSSIRPYAASNVGRLLVEAMDKCSAMKTPSSSCRQIRNYYDKYFSAEVDEAEAPRKTSSTYLKPVETLSLDYNYLSRPFSVFNNEGIDYGNGHNALLQLQSHARFFNYFSFFVQPAFIYNQHFEREDGGDRATFRLQKGYAKLTLFNVELLAGRDSLWWGPGYHGALLMSNNAHPFDMLKLSNPDPVLLPWIFSYLGPVQFNLIFSQLNDVRTGWELANPFLYGLRLGIKPHPSVELGASHLAQFGGPGRRDMSIGELFSTLYSNLNKDNQKTDSNQEFAADIAITIPKLKKYLYVIDGLKFYAEVGGEDIGNPPDRRAYLAGFALYKPFALTQAALRGEYAIMSPYSVPNAWYMHSSYPMRYEGRVFGHHAGSDAEDIFIEWSQQVGEISYRIGFDREKSGVQMKAAPQFKNQYFGEVGWKIFDQSKISFRYTYEDVYNAGYIRGERLQNHYVGVAAAIHF